MNTEIEMIETSERITLTNTAFVTTWKLKNPNNLKQKLTINNVSPNDRIKRKVIRSVTKLVLNEAGFPYSYNITMKKSNPYDDVLITVYFPYPIINLDAIKYLEYRSDNINYCFQYYRSEEKDKPTAYIYKTLEEAQSEKQLQMLLLKKTIKIYEEINETEINELDKKLRINALYESYFNLYDYNELFHNNIESFSILLHTASTILADLQAHRSVLCNFL
jgi:hypothetical protein